MSIANRLKLLLDTQSLTIKAFSEITEIPYRSVQNYLREERDPNVEALNKICKKMNINLNWLVTGRGGMFIEQISEKDLVNEEIKLLEKGRNTAPLGKKLIYQTAETISVELK
ncbi:hypothetical protein A4G19_05005 [Pasteurellaceae bacterium Macca]|nr:hypothetical protein [Pasteurellaceae bacterium Macca]